MGDLSKRLDVRPARLPQLDLDLCAASYSQYSVYRIDHASQSEPASKQQPPPRTDSVDDVLLRAIEPPDHSHLSLPDTLRQVKLTARRKQCFKQLLTRVGMSLWTLHFKHDYETFYRAYLYEHAIPRIRYALSIAFVFLSLKAAYEKSNVSAASPRHREWELVLQLHVFVALPVLLLVLLCTRIRRLDRHCELYGAVPFVVVTAILTTQKVLLQSRGPIFAMFLVFVPVFGITRFRLSTTVVLVSLMFAVHVAGLLLYQQAESATDVLFQAYNYFGGIAVGGVCHYRAEVLRRRNFVMLLPFCDEPLDPKRMHARLHDPRLKKHVLMHRSTLKFANATVDAAFYRHWYLIDPCPFDHPNAGELHRSVYRTVRFAVGGVIFAQLVLVMQDWEYLYADHSFPHAAYVVATCLRFTIVIPAYCIAPLAMLLCGTRFYWQWREQAATEDRGGLRSPARRKANAEASPVASSYSEAVEEVESETTAYVTLQTPAAKAASNHLSTREEEPAFRNNYVRGLQRLSGFIVFCHSMAMGVILLLVDQLASQRNASVAPCYFLGFLNALLFPHRSGFRVRFVYATLATVAVSALFLSAAVAVESDKVWTYASYMALTNILGMMVSHEEESLRRIFFVRMMLRSHEFRERHDAILVLEPWLKDRIRRRRRANAERSQADTTSSERNSSGDAPPAKTMVRIPTVNQMVQAAKVGASLEMGRAAIALLTEMV